MRPLRYCTQPGCPVLVVRGRCAQHHEGKRWYHVQRYRRLRLRVCVDQAFTCASCGQVQVQLEVDHIVKHDGDPRRFFDRTNLQALCPTCHSRKTMQGA